MEDRVSKYPGRTRIVPENGTEPFYATLERADEPTQEGTPLNKSTLLTDETAALFELDNTAVPDDAFKAIGQNFINGYPQIGDLRYSVLDKIDDKWLRCDGSLINNTDYPVLFERLHGDGAGRVLTETNGDVLTNIVYGNGYMVAYAKGGACTCYVTTDPSKGWTPVTITSSERVDFTICYDDGLWVAFAHYMSGYTRYVQVWTTSNPLGSWTSKSTALPLSSNITQVKFAFEYKNKTFLAAITHNGYPDTGAEGCSVYATKNLNSAWVASKVYSYTDAIPYAPALTWNNGVWVIACQADYAAQVGVYVASTTDPTTGNDWTREYEYFNSNKDGPFHLAYFNNYWILSCGTNIYVTQNLKQWPTSPTKTTSIAPTAFVTTTDYIYCITRTTILVASNPTGTWAEVAITEVGNHLDIAFDGDGNMWVVGQKNAPTFYTEAARKLPDIEVDAAYAYIRAK